MIATLHILAGEYPPQHGGVSDYTEQLAQGLAEQGAAVHVWSPGSTSAGEEPESKSGPRIHRIADAFAPASLWALGRSLNRFTRPRTLLVQYAPNAFGLRGLNVFFCLWLVWRGVVCGDDVRVMFHEPFYYFARDQKLRLNFLALVHRLMAMLLLGAGRTVYVSTPAWENLLRPYSILRDTSFIWLPVPATIPFTDDSEAVVAIRQTIQRGSTGHPFIVGHFGTYSELIRPTLSEVLLQILHQRPSVYFLCLGQNAELFADTLRQQHPEFSNRLVARGYLNSRDLSCHLQACDLFVQPYFDGATARRTSLMALLHNGRPVVSNIGQYTEPVWKTSTALALASRCDAPEIAHLALRLMEEEARLPSFAIEAKGFYAQHFCIDRTINILLEEDVPTVVDKNGAHAEAR
ncbi:MAG TPA: glycosyltransferase [Pyrinomonadaceae bacterium]|nr:glycosyltransferase [Pyrinomonadaceae bacterium]